MADILLPSKWRILEPDGCPEFVDQMCGSFERFAALSLRT
jgi:hypothetical protein